MSHETTSADLPSPSPGAPGVCQLHCPGFRATDGQDQINTKVVNAITPLAVFDRGVADARFLTGMLVDKFYYHLPLYRQHLTLSGAGIDLIRTALTNLVRRSIELREPIVDAQLVNVLLSRVLGMDETPIKVGVSKPGKGRML